MRSRRPRPDARRAACSDAAVGPGIDIERLYERHAASVSAYALRRASAADAADVVGDTFLVAWRRRREIPAEPDTLPWLYGVARRVLANQRRSRDRRTRLHDRLRHDVVVSESPTARVEDADRVARVARSMQRLSDDDAELLRLTAWEGLTPTEIGVMLRLDSGVVRQRLRRARQRLRRELAAESDVIGPGAVGSTTVASDVAVGWSAGGGT